MKKYVLLLILALPVLAFSPKPAHPTSCKPTASSPSGERNSWMPRANPWSCAA